MNKTRLFVTCILSLFVIFSAGIISANTFVAGTVYNSDFSSTISGASVNIYCDGHSLDTTSLSDGSYGVIFSENFSAKDVVVTATKGTLKGTSNSVTNPCVGSCAAEFFSMSNVNLSETSSTGGSSGGSGSSTRYYFCGNGFCDSGETIGTCPLDCKSNITEIATQNLVNETEEEITEEKNGSNFLTGSTIAGLTEFATSGAGIATGLGLITVLIGIIALVNLRKKKLVKNNSVSNLK